MAILIPDDLRLIVQGITGTEASEYTPLMTTYGTNIVGGVTPSKGGQWAYGIPVFDTVYEAVEMVGANATVIFVPPQNAPDAIYEAVDAGIKLIVCITEHIPVIEMVKIRHYIADKAVRLIGPNSAGILVPERANIGIIPGFVATPGEIGVVARSGTLMFEAAYSLTKAGMGQSTLVGLGADPIVGTPLRDIFELFEHDADTEKIVLIGEIGGRAEFDLAAYIQAEMTKPVAAYIVGSSAPTGQRMGHAGAFISEYETHAHAKLDALRRVGVKIATTLDELPELFK